MIKWTESDRVNECLPLSYPVNQWVNAWQSNFTLWQSQWNLHFLLSPIYELHISYSNHFYEWMCAWEKEIGGGEHFCLFWSNITLRCQKQNFFAIQRDPELEPNNLLQASSQCPQSIQISHKDIRAPVTLSTKPVRWKDCGKIAKPDNWLNLVGFFLT